MSEDVYAERGRWPSGNRSREVPGEAQELHAEIENGHEASMEWCVCRRVFAKCGDNKPRALNLPSKRTADMCCSAGLPVGALCFDPTERVFTCSEADAVAMSGPGARGMECEDIAIRCSDVIWRTIIICSFDGSCAHLYEGPDLAKAEEWRARARVAVGEREVYPVQCIVEGEAIRWQQEGLR